MTLNKKIIMCKDFIPENQILPLNTQRFEQNLKKILNIKHERLELTGKFYPVLKSEQIKNGKIYNRFWYKVECICDCGNVKYLFWHGIVGGQTKSCGCLQKEKATNTFKKYRENNPNARKLDPELRLLKKHYTSYKSRSKEKKLEFSLSLDDFKNLVYSPCHYCGIVPKLNFDNQLVSQAFNGIDRKNNKIGYILENSLSCCSACNFFKKDIDYLDFLHLVNTISKHRGIDFVQNKEQKPSRIPLYARKNKRPRKASTQFN